MEVYLSKKQQKMLGKAEKFFGKSKAKKINKRLNELHSATSLLDIHKLLLPGLHPLNGQKKGLFSLITKQPFRIIIEPANESYDIFDYSTINQVNVLSLDTDYH